MTNEKSNNLNALREQVKAEYQKGAFQKAAGIQQRVIDETKTDPDLKDYHWLANCLFGAQKFLEGAEALKPAHRIWPECLDIIKDITAFLTKGHKYEEALTWANKGLELEPDTNELLDHFAHIYGYLGNEKKMREHGRRSLELKDKESAKAMKVPAIAEIQVPEFNPHKPERNVIAFSLWGANERYTEGAVRNAELAQHIYPEWRCRFYIDQSLSSIITTRLLTAGAEVIIKPLQTKLFEGLFWRFHVANDPEVDRYLIRDADSIFDLREREAVLEWTRSHKHFHAMRDNFGMLDVVLAGLWGGVRGALPDMQPLYAPYLEGANQKRTADQRFMKERLWPFMRQSILIHDSIYGALGGRDFPKYHHLKKLRNVGFDASRQKETSPGRISIYGKIRNTPVKNRKNFIFPITAGRTGTKYLTNLLAANLANAMVHHEAIAFGQFGVKVPDIALFPEFNSFGNTMAIKSYWRRKFASIRQGEAETHVEISHPLAKVGLIENLHMLGEDVDIQIICLRRDMKKVAWSFANRLVFANNSFTWFLGLESSYVRNIIGSKNFLPHGMFGLCVWYATEMLARVEYYKILMRDVANIHFHDVDLEDIITEDGASELLSRLGVQKKRGKVTLPPKANETSEWMFGDKEKNLINNLVDGMNFDPFAMAEAYLKQGRRIG